MERLIRYNNAQLHYSALYKAKFFSHFIAKSFLLAVFLFLSVLFLFFAVYFIDLFYNLQQGNAKTPLFGFYVIVSPSMVPTINVNDAIVVHRQEGSEIDVGDIITFSSTDSSYPGLTVTHRVVKKDSVDSNSYVFRTKGDNNFSEDPSLVKDENIYGKVIFKITNVGYVRQFLSTGIGFVLLVVFPCVVIILSEIRRIIRLTKLKTSS